MTLPKINNYITKKLSQTIILFTEKETGNNNMHTHCTGHSKLQLIQVNINIYCSILLNLFTKADPYGGDSLCFFTNCAS